MSVAFPAADWQQSNPQGECSEEATPAAAAGRVASGGKEASGQIWIYAACL